MIAASKPSGFDPAEAERLLCAIGKRTAKELRNGITLTFSSGHRITLYGVNQVLLAAAIKRAKAARRWK